MKKGTYQPKLSKFSTNISSQPTGSNSIEEAENGLQSNSEFTRFPNTPIANTYLKKKYVYVQLKPCIVTMA